MTCRESTIISITLMNCWRLSNLMGCLWGDTMHGHCLTTLSGVMDIVKNLGWPELISMIPQEKGLLKNLSTISRNWYSKMDFLRLIHHVDKSMLCLHLLLINWKFYLSDWLSWQGFCSKNIFWMFHSKTVFWWITLCVDL